MKSLTYTEYGAVRERVRQVTRAVGLPLFPIKGIMVQTWAEYKGVTIDYRADLPGGIWQVTHCVTLMPSGKDLVLARLVPSEQAARAWRCPPVLRYWMRYARNTTGAYRYPWATTEVRGV